MKEKDKNHLTTESHFILDTKLQIPANYENFQYQHKLQDQALSSCQGEQEPYSEDTRKGQTDNKPYKNPKHQETRQ